MVAHPALSWPQLLAKFSLGLIHNSHSGLLCEVWSVLALLKENQFAPFAYLLPSTMWLNVSWRLFSSDLEVDNLPRSCSAFWNSVRFLGHSNNVKMLEFGLLAAVWPMWLETQEEQMNLLGSWWWAMKSIKGPASGRWHGRWMTFPPDYDPFIPRRPRLSEGALMKVFTHPAWGNARLKWKRVERWPREIGWKKHTKF